MANKDLLVGDYEVLAMKKITNKEFEMKLSLLTLDREVSKRKFRYLYGVIEVDYKPIKPGRRSFTIRGWSEDSFKKKTRFGGYGSATTSFPLKKRYLLKIPCDLVKEYQRIIVRTEIYDNVLTHKGSTKVDIIVKHKFEY